MLASLEEFPVVSNEMAMKRTGNWGNTIASSSMVVGQMPNWFTQATTISNAVDMLDGASLEG